METSLGMTNPKMKNPAMKNLAGADAVSYALRLFALRASVLGRGFDRERIWRSRIRIARFGLVCVRLRAGRVLLSEHRAGRMRDGMRSGPDGRRPARARTRLLLRYVLFSREAGDAPGRTGFLAGQSAGRGLLPHGYDRLRRGSRPRRCLLESTSDISARGSGASMGGPSPPPGRLVAWSPASPLRIAFLGLPGARLRRRP